MKKQNTKLILLLIVLLGLLLRLVFFSGMGTSDSLSYSKAANFIDQGIDPDSVLTLSTRLGLIYPTSFAYELFGINDFSSVLFVLITSIATIILSFYFGKLLFNEKIGLLASFLLAFFPLDVIYSTKLLSDIPSAFFMALGVYLFLYSEKNQLKHNLGYLFSGISIGIGYLIRESVLLIALFFIIYMIYKRKIKKEYFLVPLGILIIFTIEALLFLNLTADPLYRTTSANEFLEESAAKHNYAGRLDFPTGLLHYPWLFLTNKLLLFFYIPIFIATLYLLRRKEAYNLLFWFIPLLLYLSFGSTSFTQYIPFRAVDRYTSIITIPAILLLAVFLTEKKEIMKKIMPLTILTLVLSSTAVIYLQDNRNLLADLKESYPTLADLDKTIYIDSRSIQAIDYISGYKNKAKFLPYPESLSNIKDSYIVINKNMIRNLIQANKNLILPQEIADPPKTWQVIKEVGKEKDKITIYYIK
jgi:hypothetical protein